MELTSTRETPSPFPIGGTRQRRTCNFTLVPVKEDATFELEEYVRYHIRGREKDAEVLNGYVTRIVEWLKNGTKDGLLLVGGVGCGKTTLLNATCRYINALYYTDISGTGTYLDRRGFQWEKAELITEWARYDKPRLTEFMQAEWVGIDDLGAEPRDIIDYGSRLHPLADILDYRYEMRLITIITSNMRPREISEVYGSRIADRLSEMMEVIHIKEPSYRRP